MRHLNLLSERWDSGQAPFSVAPSAGPLLPPMPTPLDGNIPPWQERRLLSAPQICEICASRYACLEGDAVFTPNGFLRRAASFP